MRSGALGRAAVNVVVSVILCLAAVAIGHFAGVRINGDARQIAQMHSEEVG